MYLVEIESDQIFRRRR